MLGSWVPGPILGVPGPKSHLEILGFRVPGSHLQMSWIPGFTFQLCRKFRNYPGVACKQHRNLLANIIKVMVLNIEQQYGIRQVYLLTFDWYFLGDLSHSFKTLSQGNIPVLPESNTLALINNLQLICNRFSTIFKSCIKTRIMQLSVFVANDQNRDLGTFPCQQMKMVPKGSMNIFSVFFKNIP